MASTRRSFLLGLTGAATGAAVLLSGCRVQPLYGTVNPVGPLESYRASDDLDAITIQPIGGRQGQILHNALRNQLVPAGVPAQPAYVLEASVTEVAEGALLQTDSIATRAILTTTVRYNLRTAAGNVLLLSDSASALASYNILDSEYATYRAEIEARERSLDELARRVRQRLASWFIEARADGTLARKLYLGE